LRKIKRKTTRERVVLQTRVRETYKQAKPPPVVRGDVVINEYIIDDIQKL